MRGSLDKVNRDRYYKYNIINNSNNSTRENVPAAELRKIIIDEKELMDTFKLNLCINWKDRMGLTIKEVFWLSLINCYGKIEEVYNRKETYNYPWQKIRGSIVTKLKWEELDYLWSIIK